MNKYGREIVRTDESGTKNEQGGEGGETVEPVAGAPRVPPAVDTELGLGLGLESDDESLVPSAPVRTDGGETVARTRAVPEIEFVRYYQNLRLPFVRSLVRTTEGGYAMLGVPHSNSGFRLLKFDRYGVQEWDRLYETGVPGTPAALAQTNDGGFIAIIGSTVVKIDAEGNQQWRTTFDSVFVGQIVQTSDNGYVLAGGGLLKTDERGGEEWRVSSFAPPGAAEDLVTTSDDGYALVGRTHVEGRRDDIILRKFDTDGQEQWHRTYGGTDDEEAYSLVQTSDGGYAVAGVTWSFGAENDGDTIVLKTDSTGGQAWIRTYGDRAHYEAAYSLVQTSDDGVALTGEQASLGNAESEVFIRKVTSNGDTEWIQTHGSPDVNHSGYSVVETGDGGYAVVGRAGQVDSFLLKLAGPREVSVTGRLGDVVEVDLSHRGFDTLAFDPSQRSEHAMIPKRPDHRFPANDVGYVARVDDWESVLSTTGRFYFVPFAAGEGTLKLEGTVAGIPEDLTVRIIIEDGYSTGGDGAVTFGGTKLDVYRQQQRLRHLGYQKKYGSAITVDGLPGGGTRWVIGVFNAVVGNTNHSSSSTFTDTAKTFLNARNAPRWVRINPPDGTFYVGWASERWGTNWLQEVLDAAAANWTNSSVVSGTPLAITAASLRGGGPTSDRGGKGHRTHQAGMDLDINMDGTRDSGNPPFYRTHVHDGKQYVAAGTTGTTPRVVVRKVGACETAPWTVPPDRKAKRHTETLFNTRSHLRCVRDFIEDRPATGGNSTPYSLAVARAKVGAFHSVTETTSGARVGSILFNDPRLWAEMDTVLFGAGHGGHVHVNVEPPTPVVD